MAVWEGGGGGGSGGEEGEAGWRLDAEGCCAAPCPPSPRTAALLTCSDSPWPGWAEAKAEPGLAKKASLRGPGGDSWESTSGHRGGGGGGGFSAADVLPLGPGWDCEPPGSSREADGAPWSATAGAARCPLSGLAPVEGGAAG